MSKVDENINNREKLVTQAIKFVYHKKSDPIESIKINLE